MTVVRPVLHRWTPLLHRITGYYPPTKKALLEENYYVHIITRIFVIAHLSAHGHTHKKKIAAP
jgi:hypothetical protein